MSVLLAGLDHSVGAAVTRRLLGEGDQVRVILAPGEDATGYAGAHVATGDVGDDDLVERAAQGARTIVLGEGPRGPALQGATRAGVERAVLLGGRGDEVPDSMSWIVLLVPRSLLRRPVLSPDAVALAIDAADDLAGDPRLVADLATDEGWEALRLERPR